MVCLCRDVPEEIIEVVESEASDDRGTLGFRDAKPLLKLGIDEGVLKYEIALYRTEPDRDSLSGLDHSRTHQALTFFARPNVLALSCTRKR
jgi:hypothetical protein